MSLSSLELNIQSVPHHKAVLPLQFKKIGSLSNLNQFKNINWMVG